MSLEKERRRYVSMGNLLTILAMAGAIAGTYAQSSAEQAKQKERVDNLVNKVDEVKKDGKDTNNKVELILRKLEAMEAVDFDRRRREAARRDR
jgi:ATP-dependent protease HslVU (ClpYQ) peptidase subunit